MDKTGVKLVFVVDVMKSKRQVKGKLVHVVQIAIFRLP